MGHKIERSARVGYRCEQMFELINDIESYPEYMDGCQQAAILKRGEGWLEARLSLGWGGIAQSFVTRNSLYPPHKMTLALVDGPFREFTGQWQFDPVEGGCQVTLTLEFRLKNPLLSMAVNKMFEQVAGAQVKALCKRAQTVYG